MQKYFKPALAYAVAAVAAGVFFREFTKFNDWTSPTMLGIVHTHLFVLGTGAYLLLALFSDKLQLTQTRYWRPFVFFYNSGLILTAAMMIVRGVWQVRTMPDSGAISGIAGIGHILLACGLFLLFAVLFRAARRGQKHSQSSL